MHTITLEISRIFIVFGKHKKKKKETYITSGFKRLLLNLEINYKLLYSKINTV